MNVRFCVVGNKIVYSYLLANLSTDCKESDHKKAQTPTNFFFFKEHSCIAKEKTCNINAELRLFFNLKIKRGRGRVPFNLVPPCTKLVI